MQVWKFGGTSVGKPERMKSIRQLITEDGQPKIVVLSALSGSTNTLLSISESLNAGNPSEAKSKASELRAHYDQFLTELYSTPVGLGQGQAIVAKEFAFIDSLIATSPYTVKQEKEMVALGELLSTQIFEAFLQEEGISSALLPALDFMVIDEDNEPILKVIEQKLAAVLAPVKDKQIFVTQGFICRNPAGEVDNLKRGGSDYTASLIGGAIQAEEVQIWTDIDGMHNNDPRIVKNTFPIRELSFAEAAELAYFGAKILHPSTITPAKLKGVPVRLKNTMEPSAFGTLISEKSTDVEIKAIAAKDNITAIYIHSTRMLNAYGFLKRVFEVFEKYKTPVDMITTSEVSVSVTIDQTTHLDAIMSELREFAELEDPDMNQVIICIVGNFWADKEGIAIKVLEAIKKIPIRMISYGASEHNISLLVDASHKNDALNALNEGLF
ncbi:aspartate kinase [Aquirufa antheringensis]|uniref:Aspartokinase n=1 Tax=Aquirufa antheringensis TaxID=2516559 RepID=A0A4Q9B9Q2_9BACT|nr:aspartate kinase [Aquirufa antheringensis]MCZ2485310.1 aspartate kinase [Aquirufa antheringensis]MCZ2488293.1 aspartate kinase [Aquirufa antheringensis]MCZ2490164.1 aspartate kinase [Aquirufa antheringensis]TBH72202.1 aspartate kinase [Aquirufa antheringensis]